MTKQKVKQTLEIDLNKVHNPNPRLVAVYKDNNAMDMSFELGDGENFHSPAWTNEKRLFIASKTSGKKISHLIFANYRKKIANKEYWFGYEKLVTLDHWGNKVDTTRELGRFSAGNSFDL
jgi:hypothetical protein